MTERHQINLSYMGGTAEYKALQRHATKRGLTAGQVIREIVSDRLSLLEHGWEFQDDEMLSLFEAIASLSDPERSKVADLLAGTFKGRFRVEKFIRVAGKRK